MKTIFGKLKVFAVLSAFMFVLAVPTVAFAAGLSAAAEPASVKIGDTFTVTVTVSDKNIAVAEGVFTYDPKLLKYVSSDGGASDGHINLVSAEKGGSSSLTAAIKFQGLEAGDANINVSMKSVLDYDGKSLGKTDDAAVTVKVTPAPPEPEKSGKPDESAKPPVDYSKDGVAAKNVKGTDAQMYIWRSLESLTLPSGYYDLQVTYGGETVGGAAIPDTDFTLLYLSEKNGDNAGYYIFDAGKDALYPYVTITSVLANFTMLWPDDSIKAPEGFEPATLKWKERDMPAWTAKGSDGTVYLVYARTASGDTGLFLYNSKDKSVQRYQTFSRAEPVSLDKPALNPGSGHTGTGITLGYTVFFAICLTGLALLAASVILFILYMNKKHHKKRRPSPTE